MASIHRTFVLVSNDCRRRPRLKLHCCVLHGPFCTRQSVLGCQGGEIFLSWGLAQDLSMAINTDEYTDMFTVHLDVEISQRAAALKFIVAEMAPDLMPL